MSATVATTGKAPRVLLVGDGEAVTASTKALLLDNGFTVETASDRETALQHAAGVDVIVLDLASPNANRIEACRMIRAATNAYIVAVGEGLSELDAILNLTVGADDFVVHPVRTGELVARVHAMLRRPRHIGESPPVLHVADLAIDTGAREVRVAGEPVTLSALEYELLLTLARNPRLTLSREQLLRQVWGQGWIGDDHVIDVHISNLRRKLGDACQAPQYIRTVRGYGFRIAANVTTVGGPTP